MITRMIVPMIPNPIAASVLPLPFSSAFFRHEA
jgi:hypothetical protein